MDVHTDLRVITQVIHDREPNSVKKSEPLLIGVKGRSQAHVELITRLAAAENER